MTLQTQTPVLHLPFEIMAFGLETQGLLQQPVDSVHPAAANSLSKIHIEFGTEAHMHFAVASKAQAIAITTEIVSHRRDQAKAQAKGFKAIIAGGSGSPMVERRECAGLSQRRGKIIERDELPGSSRYTVAQRHGFDKRQIKAVGRTIFCHWQYFVVIYAFQRNHIDPNGQSVALRHRDSVQNLPKVAAAGDGIKFGRNQAVEADIDAPHA